MRRLAFAILAIAALASGRSGHVAAAESGDLPIRFGTHAGFERMVFDWREPVEYRVDDKGKIAVISFDHAARVDKAALDAGLSRLSASATIEEDGNRLVVRLTMPERTQLRHFRSGTKVVLDFARTPDEQAADARNSAMLAEIAPTAGDALAAPSNTVTKPQGGEPAAAPRKPIPLRAKQPETTPAVPATTAAAPSGPAPAATAPAIALQASAPAATAGAVATIPVALVRTAEGQGLRFGWTEPVGAAVFGRGPYLWIVFDRRATLDLSQLRGKAEDLLGTADVIEATEPGQGTILRLAPAGGTASAARREGDAWVVDIGRLPRAPDVPIAAVARNAGEAAARLMVEMPGARTVLHVRDPDIGDELIVAPTTAAGSGVERDRQFLQFRLLATAQGAVVQSRADSLTVRPLGNGLEIASASGLLLSDVAAAYAPKSAAEARAPLLFDFKAWRRSGPNRFNEDRQALHRAVAEAAEDKRNAARLDLARFLFSYGNMEGALGVLRLIEQDAPDLVATAQVRAIRGVASLLSGDLEDAQRQLSHRSLDAQPEAALWRGALAMAQGDARAARVQMGRSPDLSKHYPAPFANRLNLLNAEARLFTGDYPGAESRLDAVTANQPSVSERAQAQYLQGRLLLAKGDRDGALAVWADLERAPPSAGRTAAVLDRLDLLLEDGKISRSDAIARLDRLRFSWRGDEFEFRTLTRLGRLQIADGDYRAGLTNLRNALTLFPKHREAASIVADMSEAFTTLFANHSGQKISPVTAIALFEEFRDLLPQGARGDEMTRRLADRLIEVDLLDRAGDLLEHQVKFRLSGVEKTRAGTKLALVRLLDRKPEAALAALAGTNADEMPPDLAHERRRLEARALADLGRTAEALQRLGGDDGRDADVLRADIEWRAQNWAGAAEALDRLVGTPAPDATLPDNQLRQALHLVVALALAGDKDRLARADERLGPIMQRSPYKDIYKVVVSQPGGPVGDVREIVARVAGAAPFESFLAGYRQRLVAPKAGS